MWYIHNRVKIVPVRTDVSYVRHIIVVSPWAGKAPINEAEPVPICDTPMQRLMNGSGSIGLCPCGDTLFYSVRKRGSAVGMSDY